MPYGVVPATAASSMVIVELFVGDVEATRNLAISVRPSTGSCLSLNAISNEKNRL